MTHPPSQSGIEAAENPVKFGCLGAAKIAPGALVSPSQTHPEVVLYAVAARDKSRADAFAAKHGFQKSYGSYQGRSTFFFVASRVQGVHKIQS